MTLKEAAAQLDSPDAATRQSAADYLSRQGEAVCDVAAALASHVGDEDRIVAEYCVAALEEMGPPHQAELPSLATLLTAVHPDVVYWSATLLGRAQDAAATYAERLVEVIGAEWPMAVRQRAAWALRQLGPAAVRVAPQLEALAPQVPDPLRGDILRALATISR